VTGKYTAEARVRFRGDAALGQRYLAEGRKYLGQLHRDMELGDTLSGRRRITNAAGVHFDVSQVMGAPPVIEIDVRPVEPKAAPVLPALLGFVTRPRNFGTGAANDGENAFGLKSHVLLSPVVEEDWASRYYDASYAPGDEKVYGEGDGGRPLFPDGFSSATGQTYAGNIDWRNTTGTRAVTWIGAPERVNADATRRQPYVFFNGAVLLDTRVYTGGVFSDRIGAACLRQRGADTWLLWLVGTTLYRARLRPDPAITWWPYPYLGDCPRAAPIEEAHVEAVTVTVTGTLDLGTILSWAFNQSATEARVLHFGTTAGGVRPVFELVIDLSDLDDVTATIERVGSYSVTTTFNESLTSANFLYDAPDTEVEAAFDGSWATTPGTHDLTYNPVATTHAHSVPYTASTSGSRTTADQGGAFPIATDYANNVVSRLYFRPCTGSSSATCAETYSESETFDAAVTVTMVVPDPYTSGPPGNTNTVYTVDQAKTIGRTFAYSASGSLTGGQLFGQIEGEGSPWFSVDIGGSYATAGSSNFNSTAEQARVSNFGAGTETITNTGTSSASAEASGSGNYNDLVLWWCDLRFRSAIYTNLAYTHVSEEASASSATFSGSSTPSMVSFALVPASYDFGHQGAGSASATSSASDGVSNELTMTTTVMMHGAVVDAAVSTREQNLASSTSGTTVPSFGRLFASVSFFDFPLFTDASATYSVDPPVSSTGPSAVWPDFADLLVSERGLSQMQHEWDLPDAEAQTDARKVILDDYGFAIAYRGGTWAFSVPWLNGTFDDTPPGDEPLIGWKSAIANGDLDALTGGHGADLFGVMWPLSRAAHRLVPTLGAIP
jgi:hypothetical protein